MEKKQSIIIGVIIIAVIAIVTLLAVNLKKQKIAVQPPIAQPQTIQNQPEQAAEVVNPGKKPLPKEVRGKIVGMTPTSLIIDQAANMGALTVEFDINATPVFKGSDRAKVSSVELKSGIEVIAIIDQATKGASEITIK